jgi:hypothetical protein
MKMPLGQRHGRVEANHRKQPRDVENGLNHLLAHRGIQVVELRGVVPRKAGAVVAVIDEARFSAGAVAAAKDHGRIGLLVVVVFDLDLHARIAGEIGAFKAVRRIGRILPRDEPLRMLDHPRRIDAHVIGHHVARKPDSMPISAIAQVVICTLAAQIL